MGNLLRLAKVMGVLSRGLKSRTTKDQWAGNALFFVAACCVGALAMVYFEVSEEAVLVGILGAQQLVGPYFARAAVWLRAYAEGKAKADLAEHCIRVRHEGGKSWRVFTGTLLDAREEGWNYAVTEKFEEVRLKFMEKTGRILRFKPGTDVAKGSHD